MTHLWSWPTHGAPDIAPSWLFRVVLWPFYATLGVGGLFAWRWIATLVAFGILARAARTMGARGVAPAVAFVLCALVYRERAQVRPETLAAVFLAIEIAILEARRRGGRERAILLVPLGCLWANTHISFPLCGVVAAIYAIGDAFAARRGSRDSLGAPRSTAKPAEATLPRAAARSPNVRRAPLAFIAAAAFAAAFANPYGWRLVWQPFEFWLHQRHELIFQTIGELGPVRWSENVWSCLPILVLAWPLLIAERAMRRRADAVEIALLVIFLPLALSTQRFLGFFVLVAAPFLARDVALFAAARAPHFLAQRAWLRTGLAALACAALFAPSIPIREFRPGLGVDWRNFPVAACDFVETHDVRGKCLSPFYLGGYALWRFWPAQDRLPFMDIHQSGTPRDRDLIVRASTSSDAWRELDRAHRFDYAILNRLYVPPGDRLLDFVDADSSWALVFADDVAAVYVRRDGACAALARDAYRVAGGGAARVGAVAPRLAGDASLRAQLRAELDRQAAASPQNSEARSLLATIAIIEGRLDDAEPHLREALRIEPFTPRAHERLGMIAMARNQPRDALRELLVEYRRGARPPGIDLRLAQAYATLGDTKKAREHYERELAARPNNREAADSLRALDARAGTQDAARPVR
ncbi:MAG: tetratricopeptide repeat protein [bacterium]